MAISDQDWGRGSDVADDFFGFFGDLVPDDADADDATGAPPPDVNIVVESEPIPWMVIGGIALAAVVLLKVLP